MDKKYILTDKTTEVNGHTLHRIQAVRSFGQVKEGDLGGWIEKEDNLSHKGLCWVFDDACVYEDGAIADNAKVFYLALVHGKSLVSGDAVIYGSADIFDRAWVYGRGQVFDHAWVYENGRVGDSASVCENAIVHGMAMILGLSKINGEADICGTTLVRGLAQIYSGSISSSEQYLVIGPIGSRADFTTFFKNGDDILVSCGCFHGNIQDFGKRVLLHHGMDRYGNLYRRAIKIAKWQLK